MKNVFLLFIALAVSPVLLHGQADKLRSYSFDTAIFGKNVEIVVVHGNDSVVKSAVDYAIREIGRIEALLSTSNANSETNRINVNAGFQPVKVSNEVFNLIARSIKLSKLTNGAFDITTALFTEHYRKALHDSIYHDTLPQLLPKTGYRQIVLNSPEATVYLPRPGMMISLDGLITGYELNSASRILNEHLVNSGSIRIAGQSITWGKPLNRKDWVIGIPDPNKPQNNLRLLRATNQGVVVLSFVKSSGSNRPTACMHPKTGLPITGILAVAIVCPDAEIADGVATSVAILGVQQGLKLINLLAGVEGLIVSSNGAVHTSENFEALVIPWEIGR